MLVVAGVLSVGIYEVNGKWPAGYGGWGAALFGIVGIMLVGYFLVVQSQSWNPIHG